MRASSTPAMNLLTIGWLGVAETKAEGWYASSVLSRPKTAGSIYIWKGMDEDSTPYQQRSQEQRQQT
ncbi:MAG: hypothetical protein QXS68_07880 [Candidatus Methanomethylicaceae archaeon]